MATFTRRNLLIGGGAGVGLVVAWAAWPRAYPNPLTPAAGEQLFGPFLKISRDGQVIVAVPQAEMGQGVATALAQAVAEELGADWRTVGVEAAPIAPFYANPLAAAALFGGGLSRLPAGMREEAARREALMLTVGSTSIRTFERPMRVAGAMARALLCRAAARRWDADWRDCDTEAGFVVLDRRRLRFGDLSEAAAREDAPDDPPLRYASATAGRSLPRLDTPAKVAGAANYAADIRLPDMVFASVRHGPVVSSRLLSVNKPAAEAVPGVVAVVETSHWVAAVANNWWAADRGAAALAARFASDDALPDDARIVAALTRALEEDGEVVAERGDPAAALAGGELLRAEYHVAPALHAAIEPPAATAQWRGNRLELWVGTQAPGIARAAAAAAIGVAEAQVTIHPMPVGGGFGAALEPDVAAEAAVLAVKLRRPVQLSWSRAEALRHDRVRVPVLARLEARPDGRGGIAAWRTRIASPATGAELAQRLLAHEPLARIARSLMPGPDAHAVAGATPRYAMPAFSLHHHPADVGVPTGHLRGGADGTNVFATESFADELANRAGVDPLTFRLRLLRGEPRLARCLSTAAALGGWVAGEGVGLACHAMAGSFIAVLAEARLERGRVRVERLVAAVDCGRAINPDIVRQVIEGGLVFGAALATGGAASWHDGAAVVQRLGECGLPTLATAPEIIVELIESDAAPGGVSDIGVPAVAPAIANALAAGTGTRWRRLPLSPDA